MFCLRRGSCTGRQGLHTWCLFRRRNYSQRWKLKAEVTNTTTALYVPALLSRRHCEFNIIINDVPGSIYVNKAKAVVGC